MKRKPFHFSTCGTTAKASSKEKAKFSFPPPFLLLFLLLLFLAKKAFSEKDPRVLISGK